MAGILAPRLNEIGAAPGVNAPAADTSVGDLLSNVGSILAGIGNSRTTAPRATQSDRDNAALRPSFAKLQSLVQQRNSGDITPAAFTIQSRALAKSTIANFPNQRTTITEGFGAISGEDIAPITPDVAGSLAEDTLEFLSNSPEGVVRMPEAMRYSSDGSVDNQATLTAMQGLHMEIQGKAFRAADTKAKRQELIDNNAFTQEEQAKLIDPLLNDMSLIAGQAISKLTENFVNNGVSSSVDAVSILSGLAQTRADYLQIFTKQASDNGIVDEDRFRAGLAAVMAPFDSQIDAFTIIAGNAKLMDGILQARNGIFLTEISDALGVARTNASDEAISVGMLAASSKDIATVAAAFAAQMKLSSIIEGTKGPVVDADGVPTDSAVETIESLDRPQLVADIKGNVEGFQTISTVSDETLAVDNNREFLVGKFVLATGIIDTTGAPITEETFSKIYPSNIVKQYNRIVTFDDDTALKFKKTVTRNLGNILNRRQDETNAIISNDFQASFPSMNVQWNGSSFVIALNGTTGTKQEKLLVDSLVKLGLPLTLEGIEKLGQAVRREQIGAAPSGLDPKDVRTFESNAINIQLDSFTKLKKSLGFLNRVAVTAGLFPEEISTNVLPTKTGTTGFVIIDTNDQMQALEPGTAFFLKGEDTNGTPHIRGSEVLPGGNE